MAKLQISMDDALKTAAEKVIAELGLTSEAVITVLYKQIVEHGKLPFPIEQTDSETPIAPIKILMGAIVS